MATRPRYKLKFKPKDTKQQQEVLAFFKSDKGPGHYGVFAKSWTGKNGEMPGVDKIEITLSDGTIIDGSNCFIDLYDEESR